MNADEQQRSSRATGVKQRTMEIVMAVFFFAIGVVMIVDNYRLGAGWAKDGPESGYFPLRVGVIICISAAILLVQRLLGKARDEQVFVTMERLKPVLLVLAPTALYVLAIQFIGIYVASAVFIAAFMRVMGRYGWVKTLLVSIGFAVVLFWLFEVQFMVPLPKGPLETLLGY
jgi:putative tricarboxylic transport membrane protein